MADIDSVQYVTPKLNTSINPVFLDNKKSPFYLNLKKDRNSLLKRRNGLWNFDYNSKLFVDLRLDKSNQTLTCELSNNSLSGLKVHLYTSINNNYLNDTKELYIGLSYGETSKIALIDSGLGSVNRDLVPVAINVFQYNKDIYCYLRMKQRDVDQNSSTVDLKEVSCIRKLQIKTDNNITINDFLEGIKNGTTFDNTIKVQWSDHDFTQTGATTLLIPKDFSNTVSIKIGERETNWLNYYFGSGQNKPIYNTKAPSLITGVAIYNELLFISLYDTALNKTVIYYPKTQLATDLSQFITLSGRVLDIMTYSNFILAVQENAIKKLVYGGEQLDKDGSFLGYIFIVETVVRNFSTIKDNKFILVNDSLYVIGSRSYKIALKEGNQVYLNENYLEPIDNDVMGLFDSFTARSVFYNKETNNIEVISALNNNIIADLIWDSYKDNLDQLFKFSFDSIDVSTIARENFSYFVNRIDNFILKYDVITKEWQIECYMGHIFTIIYNDLYINETILDALTRLSANNNFTYKAFNTSQVNVIENRRKSNLFLSMYEQNNARSEWYFGDNLYPFPILLTQNIGETDGYSKQVQYNARMITNNWLRLLNRDNIAVECANLLLNDSITYSNGGFYELLNSSKIALNTLQNRDENTSITNINIKNTDSFSSQLLIKLNSYMLSTVQSITILNSKTR